MNRICWGELGHRSKHEIFAAILECASRKEEGVGITKIMYNSYLSYNSVSRYISEVLTFGLLVYDGNTKLFRITAKGQRFLKVFSEMNEMVAY